MELPVETIVSGGQTGADRGALDAALTLGVPHGGWCPRGRRAEDGPIPPRYRLSETDSTRYSERTEKNVVDSDGTLLVTRGTPTGGSALTARLARKHKRPLLCIDLDATPQNEAAAAIRNWLTTESVRRLNVAGPRLSTTPGIDSSVEELLIAVWRGKH